MTNLKIDLDTLIDKNKNNIYIGRLDAPISLNLHKGVAFLVFLSDEGTEELQIANLDSDNTFLSKVYQNGEKLKIKLAKRVDGDKNVYYLAKLQMANTIVDCSTGCSFMIFTSKEGNEELQLEAKIKKIGGDRKIKQSRSSQPEIIYNL